MKFMANGDNYSKAEQRIINQVIRIGEIES